MPLPRRKFVCFKTTSLSAAQKAPQRNLVRFSQPWKMWISKPVRLRFRILLLSQASINSYQTSHWTKSKIVFRNQRMPSRLKKSFKIPESVEPYCTIKTRDKFPRKSFLMKWERLGLSKMHYKLFTRRREGAHCRKTKTIHRIPKKNWR